MEQIQETIENNNAGVEQKFADLVEGLTFFEERTTLTTVEANGFWGGPTPSHGKTS
jgi:hypothetical protein